MVFPPRPRTHYRSSREGKGRLLSPDSLPHSLGVEQVTGEGGSLGGDPRPSHCCTVAALGREGGGCLGERTRGGHLRTAHLHSPSLSTSAAPHQKNHDTTGQPKSAKRRKRCGGRKGPELLLPGSERKRKNLKISPLVLAPPNKRGSRTKTANSRPSQRLLTVLPP